MSNPSNRGPARIRFYLDFDGTLATDLIAYKLLCYPIPELNYFPAEIDPDTQQRSRLDLTRLNDLFVQAQREEAMLGGDPSGPDVCNSVMIDLVRDGWLKGLNDDVLRAVGKKIRLFPGVIEFMEDARHLVEAQSEGQMTVDFVILSAGLREATVGTVFGDLMQGDNPLVADITGQRFRHRNGEISGVSRSFAAADKREYLAQDVLRGAVLKEHQIAIGDGATDGSMFTQAIAKNEDGKHGRAYIVCPAEAHNPAHRMKRLKMAEFRRSFPQIDGVFNANWSETIGGEDNAFYFNLMCTLDDMVESHMRQSRQAVRVVEPEGRAGTPATYVDLHGNRIARRDEILLGSPTRSREYSEAQLTPTNAHIDFDNNPSLCRVMRTLAQYKVRAALAPRTARDLLRGDTPEVIHVDVAADDPKSVGLPGAISALTGNASTPDLPEQGSTARYQIGENATLAVTTRPAAHKQVIKTMKSSIAQGNIAAIQVNGSTVYPLAHDLSRSPEMVTARNSGAVRTCSAHNGGIGRDFASTLP